MAAWTAAERPIVRVRHASTTPGSPLRPDQPGHADKPEVETTARFAGNLGYDVLLPIDATFTFDRAGPDGTVITADQYAATTAANIHGEFGRVVRTADVVAASG